MASYVEIVENFLNINFLSVHKRRGAIRTGLDFAFEFFLDTLSSTRTSSTSKAIMLNNFDVKLYRIENDISEVYLGKLIPRKPTISLQANIKSKIIFKLDQAFSEQRQLEKLKEATDLQFLTVFGFSSEIESDTKSKTMHKTQLKFNVDKNDWPETFFSQMRFFNRPVFTF